MVTWLQYPWHCGHFILGSVAVTPLFSSFDSCCSLSLETSGESQGTVSHVSLQTPPALPSGSFSRKGIYCYCSCTKDKLEYQVLWYPHVYIIVIILLLAFSNIIWLWELMVFLFPSTVNIIFTKSLGLGPTVIRVLIFM